MSFYWLGRKRISTVGQWKKAVIDAVCDEACWACPAWLRQMCHESRHQETGHVQKWPLGLKCQFFRDVLDKAAEASSPNGLLLICTKRGSCSICNCITERGGRSQRKEMRLVQHLLRVSLFLYSKQNKGSVRLVPELFTVISQMKS